jgi:aspartate dehydrogenase
LFKKAEKAGITIYIPSGAICGIDGISAFPASSIRKVTLTTIKSPTSLTDVDGTADESPSTPFTRSGRMVSLSNQSAGQEQVIFEGGVKEAIQKFPKNINVSALLFLASHYKDIKVCIKTDPKIKRNVHKIEVDSEYGSIRLIIENVPSPGNPRTSYLTILSIENLLRKIVSCVKIGS